LCVSPEDDVSNNRDQIEGKIGVFMFKHAGAHFDPETIALMDAVLDEAWASLLPHQQDEISRIDLAKRILNAAARGERDPKRLRAFALNGIGAEAAIRSRRDPG
jgi:hypothetical protein